MREFQPPAPGYGDALKAALNRELDRKGMRRDDFCMAIGIPKSTLYKILDGTRDLNVRHLLLMADMLEVSCDYLLGRGNDAPDVPIRSRDTALVEYLEALVGELGDALESGDKVKMKGAIKYALLLLNDMIYEAKDDRIQAED